ncbi:MAG: hypothetical protein LBT59_22705 [Clostridiales bacterium]|nr:hypothetical protein [Clostridiales bacterium]
MENFDLSSGSASAENAPLETRAPGENPAPEFPMPAVKAKSSKVVRRRSRPSGSRLGSGIQERSIWATELAGQIKAMTEAAEALAVAAEADLAKIDPEQVPCSEYNQYITAANVLRSLANYSERNNAKTKEHMATIEKAVEVAEGKPTNAMLKTPFAQAKRAFKFIERMHEDVVDFHDRAVKRAQIQADYVNGRTNLAARKAARKKANESDKS